MATGRRRRRVVVAALVVGLVAVAGYALLASVDTVR
jgi:hypothetical protein